MDHQLAKGVTLHRTCSQLTEDPPHQDSATSATFFGKHQAIPHLSIKLHHIVKANLQWIKRWLMVSSPSHITQRSEKFKEVIPLLRLSTMESPAIIANQQSASTCGGANPNHTKEDRALWLSNPPWLVGKLLPRNFQKWKVPKSELPQNPCKETS